MARKRTGRDLVIRRLFEVDQDAILDHFSRLDIDSRRARFCGAVSTKGVTNYAQSIFRFDSIIIGALVDGQIRGVAELRGVLHFWPSTAEAAFSVEPDWQNIGIGDALLERVISMAQNRRVRSIRLMCLKENRRMRHLANKHDARLGFDHDCTEAILHPGMPTPASVVSEMIGETRRFTGMLNF